MNNLVNSSILSPIPSIFGNGLLGTAITGLVRIPSYMSNAVAILMVGELAIRMLSESLSFVGFKQQDDSWVSKASNTINGSGIRPYKDYTSANLAVSALGFAALGIVGSEFVRVAGGNAPRIYNNVLAFLGPIRIDHTPYLTVIGQMVGRTV